MGLLLYNTKTDTMFTRMNLPGKVRPVKIHCFKRTAAKA